MPSIFRIEGIDGTDADNLTVSGICNFKI